MERLLILLVVVVVGFIIVSRFVEEATIKLIAQIILVAVLVYAILKFAGIV